MDIKILIHNTRLRTALSPTLTQSGSSSLQCADLSLTSQHLMGGLSDLNFVLKKRALGKAPQATIFPSSVLILKLGALQLN